MAFCWDGWGVLRPWASGFTVWHYRTADTLEQVLAVGYFDPLIELDAVQAEDWIAGHAAGETPIELVVRTIGRPVAVEPLHRWFERIAGCQPLH